MGTSFVKNRFHRRGRRPNGVALLIAIFVVLLICVVGIAMIVASGTDTALAGNYQSSTTVYYAALAGLEEGRGRLLPMNPNYFANTDPTFLPAPGSPLALTEVRYILNPVGAETVDPTDTSTPSSYPDMEYNQEFLPYYSLSSADIKYANSVSDVAGIPGPAYKWVRINAVTEQSLNLDVDGSGTPLDHSTPLYFDGTKLNTTGNGQQALELTALAALPNGTRKTVQYVVAPTSKILDYFNSPPSSSLNFYAAISLLGTNTEWNFPWGADSASFFVDGNDYAICPGSSPQPSVFGLGVSSAIEPQQITGANGGVNSMPRTPTSPSNYKGRPSNFPLPPMTPSIGNISGSLPLNLQKPSGIEALIQVLHDNADVVLTGPATGSDLPSTMSSTNPFTVFVNGNLTLSGGTNGYGILVVTGNFNYTGSDNWKGLVFVLGQGTATEAGGTSGGRFYGAVVIAKSRDAGGAVLPDAGGLGASYIDFNNGDGSSFYYSSCWIRKALKPTTYKVLSFHEIAQ